MSRSPPDRRGSRPTSSGPRGPPSPTTWRFSAPRARRGRVLAADACPTSSRPAPSTSRCSIPAVVSNKMVAGQLSDARRRWAHPSRAGARGAAARTRCWCRSCTPTTRSACCRTSKPIGACCRERGVPLHVDAAQSAGKVRDRRRGGTRCDLLSFTAHKLYGPKGIGALYVTPQRRAALQPLMFGGGQERGLRSGTLAGAPDRRFWAGVRTVRSGGSAGEPARCGRCGRGYGAGCAASRACCSMGMRRSAWPAS